jgi:hypothetical protein
MQKRRTSAVKVIVFAHCMFMLQGVIKKFTQAWKLTSTIMWHDLFTNEPRKTKDAATSCKYFFANNFFAILGCMVILQLG